MIKLLLAIATQVGNGSLEKTADEWIAALNTRSPEKIRSFHAVMKWTDDPEYAMRDDLNTVRRANKLQKVKVLSSNPSQLKCLVRLTAVDEYTIFTVSKDTEGQLDFSIRYATPSETPNFPTVTETNLVELTRKRVELVVKAGKFSGSFLLAKDGVPIYKAHHGFANRLYAAKNRFDTKFAVASVGKMFTATCIGKLIDQNKLRLSTPVGEVLPDYPNEKVKKNVTVGMLLSHKSGIPNYMTEQYLRSAKDEYRTVASYFPLFKDLPLDFEPGTQFSYTNSGYLVLGAIIEKITGTDYWSAIDKEIFQPLGMTNTGPFGYEEEVQNQATGYTYDPLSGPVRVDKPINALFQSGTGSAHGGSFSTVPDLFKFITALESGKLVKQETLNAFKTPTGKLVNVGGREYGFGFEVRTFANENAWGHSGGHPGSNSYVFHFEKSKYSIVTLANLDEECSRLGRHILMYIAEMKK